MESDSSPDVDKAVQADERTTLLSHGKQCRDDSVSGGQKVPPRVARRLYVSHFLSTWNSRVFEFGAVLYLAKIFPDTLLPMSIYAFARSLSALIFSSAIGRYIDENDRLKVVRSSIGTPLPCPWFRRSVPA
jgi:solute carrier family 40 (iron-regulated transporter), member 1